MSTLVMSTEWKVSWFCRNQGDIDKLGEWIDNSLVFIGEDADRRAQRYIKQFQEDKIEVHKTYGPGASSPITVYMRDVFTAPWVEEAL